jgi:hypothetical protein
VYAPGVTVYTYVHHGGSTSIGADTGTSFATPQVAGLAGLIRYFDSRLSIDSIRRLIDTVPASSEDSVTEPGGRTAPLINAYASLERAGQRTGAPLCGNAVWTDTLLNLKVLRHGTTLETIATNVPANVQEIPHGGHKIFFNDGSPVLSSLSFSPTGWHLISPDTAAYDSLSGQYLSDQNMMKNENHDGDSTYLIGTDTLYVTDASGQHVVGTFSSPGCGGPENVAAGSQTIYFECLEYPTGSSYQTTIYALPLGTTTATGLVTISNADPISLSISEDGTTLNLTYQTATPTYHLMNSYSTASGTLTLIHAYTDVNQFTPFSPMRVAGPRHPPTIAASKTKALPRGRLKSEAIHESESIR